MILRNLRDFEKSDFVSIFDEGSSLNVSPGFVSDLHEELAPGRIPGFLSSQKVKDVQVDRCTQVVNVGNKHVLFALRTKWVVDKTLYSLVLDI